MFRKTVVALSIVSAAAWAQTPAVRELWSQVVVYRDEWGTPHVYADNVRALAFGFGYAQAEDHAEAMLLAYRVANGRAAELRGEAYAKSDEFAIMLDHAGIAARAFAAADSVTRDLCEGFAFGVNTWLIEHPGRVPPWAEGVRPADVLALLHCYLMSFAPFDLPGTYYFPPAAQSGNAWAVAPARSRTRETLLVINPHTAYDGPFQWYEAHLSCQDLNIAGAALYGLPVILQGHNGLLGWALTPNQPDTADIYVQPELHLPSRGPGISRAAGPPQETVLHQLLLGNTRPYYVSMPYGLEPRHAPRLDTPQGPIVGSHNGRLCALKAGGYGECGALAQLVEMGRAQTLEEFQSALRMQQLPCFHVVYGDRSGNIMYLYNAKVGNKYTPEGSGGAVSLWRAPVSAVDSRFAWGDVAPVELLPLAVNPTSGFVQACGSPPWDATSPSGIQAENWPAWFAADVDTLRARRVRRLLGMGPRSFQDMQAMLYDVLVPAAVESVPLLLRAAQGAPGFVATAHPDLPVGLDLLRGWNYVAETNSTAMTFFRVWWATLRAQAGPAAASEAALADALEKDTPEGRTLALKAADEAAKTLRNQFQTLTVPWGSVHQVRRGDREEPMPGSLTGEPIFLTADASFSGNEWPVSYGYGFAMAVKFGERPEAVSMVPFGASNNPESAHYDDQLDLMLQRRFKRTRFFLEDVQRNCERARGRMIQLRPSGMEALFTLNAAEPIEARLNTATAPPAPLPEGLATFTVYVRVERVPRAAAVEADMEIFIADVLCDAQRLGQLAVYGYDAARGWVRLDAQRLASEARTFRARDDAADRWYAVLGPANLRLSPEAPAPDQESTPTVPGLPGRDVGGPSLEPSAPPDREPVWLAREAAPVIPRVELPLTPVQVVETGIKQLAAAPPEETQPPLQPSGSEGKASPAEPRSKEMPPPRKPKRSAMTSGRGLLSVTDTEKRNRADRGKKKKEAAESALARTESGAPESAAPAGESSAAQAPQQKPAIQSPIIARPEDSTPLAAPAPVAEPIYPTVSAWGREIQLRPPGMDGLVVLRAPIVIRAALFVSDEPPAPVPAGLAAFTKFIGFHFSPPEIRAEAAITLRLPEGVCAAENLAKLGLYAYDKTTGWTRVPNQKLESDTRAFSALDDAARPYAILGPLDCLLTR